MKKPAISVIVPVYKAEKYIHKCVDSILSQTFRDFEVLLIDDGSPDKSGEICDEYAIKDNRVKVFHKGNGGVSSARNLGLDKASGKWVAFVDSDDWVEKDYLQALIGPTKNEYVEFVVSGIRYFFLHRKLYQTMFTYPDMIIDINNMPQAICDLHLLGNGCPVAKLFLKEIIERRRLYFNTALSINEDHLFVIQYYNSVAGMATVKSIAYNYLFDFHVPSLTKTFHSSEEFITIAKLMAEEFSVFTDRYRNLDRDYWRCVEPVFGYQQTVKAIDYAICNDNIHSVFDNIRNLLLKQQTIADCHKSLFQKLRFYLLQHEHDKALKILVQIQIHIRNMWTNLKRLIKVTLNIY